MANEELRYPVGLEVQRPETQSRLTNFPLFIGLIIRAILLIPHFIVLYFFGILAAILYFIATCAILITGVYPRGPYNLVLGYMRWNARANSYFLSLYDKYPPFNMDENEDYPLTLTVVYPESSSRILNFPILGFVIRTVLLIPHFIIVMFLGLAMYIVIFIAKFAILFTGSFPVGMHGFCVGAVRWNTRLTAYTFGLSDKYPPFSLD